MGRWKIGSFTAALGCIALGVIIVMAQYDMISYEVLGFYGRRCWSYSDLRC